MAISSIKSAKDRPMQQAVLQPNTKHSSRAAIFGDNNSDSDGGDKDFVVKRGGAKASGRDGRREADKKSAEDDAALAKSILERLLQGSIEIQENNDLSSADHAMEVDTNDQAEDEDSNKQDDEDEGMEFRLFASQKEPAKVTLTTKEPEVEVVHIEREELDEDPASLRMRQIAEAAISPELVLRQSQEPWERQFFTHHIRHLTQKDQHLYKKKKSKKQREWAKKVETGQIDEATIQRTARKVKVAESYGRPTSVRKGLGRGTIDSGRPAFGGYYGNGATRGRGGWGGFSGRGRGISHGRGGRGGSGRGGAGRGQSRGAFGAVRRGGSFHRA